MTISQSKFTKNKLPICIHISWLHYLAVYLVLFYFIKIKTFKGENILSGMDIRSIMYARCFCLKNNHNMAAINILYLCFYHLISVYIISLPAPQINFEWMGKSWKMNWKDVKEEQSVPNLRLLSANCLMFLKITTKTLARDRKYRIRDWTLALKYWYNSI